MSTTQRLQPCERCGTPTWRWRGSVHGFQCAQCMTTTVGLDRPPSQRELRAARLARPQHHEQENA